MTRRTLLNKTIISFHTEEKVSNIEQIYNILIAEEKLKNGSKYERLAAVVYKILNETDTVIHDLRLRGEGKSANHQIDVTIEKDGKSKRILIECKQYDKVVGISVIRDFYGAVSQIKPDEAFVVTTVGYTRGAINFARDENIKLAILREAKDADWDGLIRTIVINMTAIFMGTPKITWLAYDEVEKERVNKLFENRKDEVKSIRTVDQFFYDENFEAVSNYQDVMKPILNAAERTPGELTKNRYEFNKKMFVMVEGYFVAIKGFEYEFSSFAYENQIIVDDGGKVATILYKVLESEDKVLLFDKEIEKWAFDNNGVVIEKD